MHSLAVRQTPGFGLEIRFRVKDDFVCAGLTGQFCFFFSRDSCQDARTDVVSHLHEQ